jgi:predicted O-linked N-acetylglucosamine transferase (SPINDLY family)
VFAARLAARLSERGLSPERQLRHVPWCPAGPFYGLMKASTALLDTVGFSGFNTVVQAIECDLPVVTLQGRYLRGRLGSGTLDALGAGDHVSADAGAYVARAVELATDPVARARAVERLRAGRPLLYRDTGPLQELADFLEAAVDRAVAR